MSRIELVETASEVQPHRARRGGVKPVRLSSYDVLLDGERIGQVSKRMLTRERRTPGRRYVNNRWSSPGWTYGPPEGLALECTSRREGVERLLCQEQGLSRKKAEELSKTAMIRKEMH